ncbi:MAG: ATP-binding protein [Cyclobacteriaceae bacterium]
MIARQLSPLIIEMAWKMPIISITGPRQSGKTTLAKMCFPGYDYANLESPETRLAAMDDPKAFLKHHSGGLIIDEAQRFPELFSYLQVISDESGKPGEYIITGSQNFLLKQNISQSLAGRVFISHLLPFSISELTAANLLPPGVNEAIFKGFYPRLYDKDIAPGLFYPSYNQTYLERDIGGLISPQNVNLFRKFMELLAGRTGQIINFSALGIEVGVDYKTIQSWCSLLEAGFMIFFLRPYFKNFSKRIVKSPKVYFYDTGLACNLLGIRSAAELDRHWARGALFENMVISDIAKNYSNAGQQPSLYFWRENKGVEIDLLLPEALTIKAVEIKSGTTVNSSFFSNLEKFEKYSDTTLSKILVYGGDRRQTIKGTTLVPWKEVGMVGV